MNAVRHRLKGVTGTAPVLRIASNDAEMDRDPTPRRSRLRLDTVERVRRELVKLYREGRDGGRSVADVSRLANVLGIVGRLIEGDSIDNRATSFAELVADATYAPDALPPKSGR